MILIRSDLIKKAFLSAASKENIERLQNLKGDLEIYQGFYLIYRTIFTYGRFMNGLNAFAFWNMMRIRFVMNPSTKDAFNRLNDKVKSVMSHDLCPAPVKVVLKIVYAIFVN